MNLINTWFVLVCLSSEQYQIAAKLDSLDFIYKDVNKDVEDVANRLFSALKLSVNYLNKPHLQEELQVHNDIKKIVNTIHRIFNVIADINVADVNNNKMYNAINETPNITIISIDHAAQIFHDYTSIIEENIARNHSTDSLQEFIKDFMRKYSSRRSYERNRRSGHRLRRLNNFKLDAWTERNTTRRVYKGTQAKIAHYPFMVTIHENNQFVCSGCIIRRDLVISSASCLQTIYKQKDDASAPSIIMRVGSNYVHKDGYEIAAVYAIFHPSYDPISLRNNLVLLSVHDNAFNRKKYEWIKRVKYLRGNVSDVTDEFDNVRILGWGHQSEGEDSNNQMDKNQTSGQRAYETRLSFDSLDTYNLEECMGIYSRYYVTKNNLCAGFILSGNGVCKYDVGGPGIHNGLLVGIISFGPARCGSKDKPTVFTKLAPYIGWIHEIAHQVIPRLKKKAVLAKTRKQGTMLKHDFKKNKHSQKSTFNKTNTGDKHKAYREIDKLLENIAEDISPFLNQQYANELVHMNLELSNANDLNTTGKSYWLDYVTMSNARSISKSNSISPKLEEKGNIL